MCICVELNGQVVSSHTAFKLLRLESMNVAYTAMYCIHDAVSCRVNTANMLQVYCNSIREW